MKPITTHKTLIAICMVFLITVSLAACLGGNEDDTEGVESTTTPGTTTTPSTTANTSNNSGLAPVERSSDKPDPVNDPISTKALQGRWTTTGTTWVFDDNGRFAQMEIRSSSTWQTDRFGNSGYRSTAATNRLIYGEYKVSGGVIKFSNCSISSSAAFGSDYFNNINANDALANMAKTPMSDFGKYGNYTAEFEFIDASLLRIRLNNDLDTYDSDLTRAEGSATVQIPTHRIPPAKWPSGMLSPDMPAYTGDRIREVSSYDDGETALPYRYFWTTIDRTSSGAFIEYIEKLRAAGWSGPDSTEILNGINEVDPDSYLYNSYTTHFRKGCYNLIFTVYPGENFKFEISSKRQIEGVWPSDLFGNEFRPPAGAVIIGEIDADGILGDDGHMFLFTEIDFWPGSPDEYLNSLKSKGFEQYSFIYDAYKETTINGKIYEVGIDVDPIEGTNTAMVMYSIRVPTPE